MASHSKLLRLAIEHHTAGRARKAQELYARILAADPKHADTLHRYGILTAQAGETDAALSLLRRAVENAPDNVACRETHAAVLGMAGRWAEAHAALRCLLALQPDVVEGWRQLAVACHSLNQPDRTIDTLRWADRLCPGHAETQERLGLLSFNRGVRRLESGQAALALPDLMRAVACLPLDGDLLFHLGNALAMTDQGAEALAAYRLAVVHAPDHSGAWYNLGMLNRNARRLMAALPNLTATAVLDPGHIAAREYLVLTLEDLDRSAEAAAWGTEVLTLKDHAARSQAHSLPPLAAHPADVVRRSRNIIGFSLWGDHRVYTDGAVENARVAPTVYPGWTCRFYHDDSVPRATLNALTALGAELVAMPPGSGPTEGLFWRFLTSDDPTVARFLCRDADSCLNPREKAAVDAWIASGKPFHVMRDHVLHTELMLAGLWGGVGGLLPRMADAVSAKAWTDAGRWQDQRFLRDRVWPLIRPHALVHDSVHPSHGEPFPDVPTGMGFRSVGARVER